MGPEPAQKNSGWFFRSVFLGWVAFLGVLVGACTETLAQDVCLPQSAMAERNALRQPEIRSSDSLRRGAVRLYVDFSLGMRGYAQATDGKDGTRAIYAELIRALLVSVVGFGQTVEFQKFGPIAQAISDKEFQNSVDPSFYVCPAGPKSLCEQTTYSVPQIFSDLANMQPDEFGAVISDLMISGGEFESNNGIGLAAVLDKILGSGKAIGVLGVRTAFKGVVRGLLNGAYYSDAQSRPVFLVTIGPIEKVKGLFEELQRRLLDGMPQDFWHFSVFTTDLMKSPAYGHPQGPKPISRINGENIKRADDLGASLGPVDQYLLSDPHGSIALAFDFDRLRTSVNTMPFGEFNDFNADGQQLWMQSGSEDCPKRWTPLPEFQPFATGKIEGSLLQFRIFGEDAEFFTDRVFLWRLKVGSKGLVENGFSWFGKDWSYSVGDEGGLLANKVQFFPTLNLHLLGDALQAAQQRNNPANQLVDYLMAFKFKR